MTGGTFLYFWRQYEASVSGSTKKRVRCIGCSHVFEYEITREGWGRGDSPYSLSNAAAATNAKMRAGTDLARALNETIEPWHCPACGIFQPDMVRLLRKQYGKQFNPNKYASERIGSPGAFAGMVKSAPWEALRAADAENTVEAYTKLMETWPYVWFSAHARQRIYEIKYPPFVRWLRSHFWWIVWGAVVLLSIGIIAVGESFYYPN
jgi:hypothetical protein